MPFYPNGLCASSKPDTLKMGSGLPGGLYYLLGEELQLIFTNHPEITVLNQITEGSSENISLIVNDDIDLAIVQEDYLTIDQDYRKLVSLYEEFIFVFCHINSNYFGKNFYDVTGSTLGIPKNPVLENNILKMLAEGGTSDVSTVEIPEYRDLVFARELLKVDYLVLQTGIGSQVVNELMESNYWKLVKISEALLQKHFSQGNLTNVYDITKIELPNSYNYHTISVRANLLAKNSINEQVVSKFIDEFWNARDKVVQKYPQFKKITLNKQFENIEDYRGSVRIFYEDRRIKYRYPAAAIFLFVIIISLMYIIIGIIGRSRATDNLLKSLISPLYNFIQLIRKFKYLVVLFLCMLVFVSSVFIINSAEKKFALENNTEFENISFDQVFVWLYVFFASGYENDIFPKSSVGKIVSATLPLIGLSIFFLLLHFINSDTISRKLSTKVGRPPKSFSNHLIIFGWKPGFSNLIRRILNDKLVSAIVIVADMEYNPIIKHELIDKSISYIKSNSFDASTFDSANLREASQVIIATNDLEPRLILHAKKVTDYYKSYTKRKKLKLWVDSNTSVHDDIIIRLELGNFISTKYIYEKFINWCIEDSLKKDFFSYAYIDHHDSCQIRSIEIGELNLEENLDFSDIYLHLREKNQLALGIVKNGVTIVSKNTIPNKEDKLLYIENVDTYE